MFNIKIVNVMKTQTAQDRMKEYIKMHEKKKQTAIDVKNGKYSDLPTKYSKFGR